MKNKSAETLVREHPGVAKRRDAIILALCSGGVGMVAHYSAQGSTYAKFIVTVANGIIEATEQ